jgi:hypothetical protein
MLSFPCLGVGVCGGVNLCRCMWVCVCGCGGVGGYVGVCVCVCGGHRDGELGQVGEEMGSESVVDDGDDGGRGRLACLGSDPVRAYRTGIARRARLGAYLVSIYKI